MASFKIKKICVMIGSRANYSSIKSFLILCKRSKNFKLQIVLFSSAILHRFGDLSKILKKDGFKVNFKINTHIEGENLNTMVKSTGLGLMHIPEILDLLKPNMVLTGYDASDRASTDEVANATLQCFFRSVPAAVPGIAFLSGGQSDEDATAHLNKMNQILGEKKIWNLTFSYGRALQQPALKAWQGKEENVKSAQDAFLNRAKLNGLASAGKYSTDME